MHGLTSSETHCKFNFITISDELANFAQFCFKVVHANIWPEPNFLQLIALLRLACLPFFLGCQIPQLAVIQQPGHRRVCVRRHLHEVKLTVPRAGQGIGHGHYSELFAILPDHSNLWHANLLVDPVLSGDNDTSVWYLCSGRRTQC